MAAASTARRSCWKRRVTRFETPSYPWSISSLPTFPASALQGRNGEGPMDQVETAAREKSRWRRIVDYPLVTMVIAVALYIVTVIVAGALDKLLMPNIPGFSFEMKFDLLGIPLLLLLYVFVIAKLGERPHNDYRDPKALRHLLLGIAAGLGIFSVAVAIAAGLGVYHVTGLGDLSGLLAALVG